MTDLLEASKALLAIHSAGVASHPIPGAAVECLEWTVAEIERLRSDIALLGPVTTPVSGELCSSCIEPMVHHWTYCPYCGAQGRLNAAGEKI